MSELATNVSEASNSLDHQGEIIDKINNYNVIDCIKCGYAHILPTPLDADLEKIYEEVYYSTEKPQYISNYEKDHEWWNLQYNDRYDFFEKNLPNSRRKILDVGSGPGLFLLQGKNRGWDALGIEPSNQAAQYSKEQLCLNVLHEFLTPETKGLGLFDVVHMSEVIEHLPRPVEMLKTAYDLLEPGGYVCVVAPNDYNPIQKTLREVDEFDPWWLDPPHHINYFNPESLANILKTAGFQIAHVTTTFPIDLFLLMGDNYVGNDTLGRTCHGKRKKFELSLDKAGFTKLRRELYEQFAKLSLGREVIVYGKKAG